MKAAIFKIQRLGGRASRGFSLIEIMVTVALLSFIILGLVAMFGQTQRAFTSSMTQTDMLETGRAVTDMLARELAEMTPSYRPGTTNFFAETDLVNFSAPLLQALPGPPGAVPIRTNVVQQFFFLSRANLNWNGIGYVVIPDSPNAGVGKLYRYFTSVHNNRRDLLPLLSSNFIRAPFQAGLTEQIADGIVHFRMKAFDREGHLITPFWPTNRALVATTARYWDAKLPDQVDSYFVSNAVPASVELEVGVLESQTLQRFKSLAAAGPAIQRQYLSNHVGQVHLFRQRIPVRDVDPTAYQ